jgi:hypothetical protein
MPRRCHVSVNLVFFLILFHQVFSWSSFHVSMFPS